MAPAKTIDHTTVLKEAGLLRVSGQLTLLADADPSAEALNDDEVSARLRRIAGSGVLRQLPADDVTDRRVTNDNWDRQADALLPDRVVSEWTRLKTRRPASRPAAVPASTAGPAEAGSTEPPALL
jgi:hypothetical protein